MSTQNLCMILAVFGFAFAIPAYAKTSLDDVPDPIQLFPPANCSASEARVMFWQDKTSPSTSCVKAQDVLKAAVPNCKTGQFIVYDGNTFACGDAPASQAKAAK